LKRNERGFFVSKVLSNVRLKEDTFLLSIERPPGFPEAQPGHFISIRVSEGTSPLLMRPFSIMFLTGEEIGLFVRVVGRGSRLLSEKRKGDSVSFIGPLGGSVFPEPGGRDVVMVAGGTGIAPMLFAVSRWFKGKGKECILLYGGNGEEDIVRDLPGLDEVEVHYSTIDGSLGFRGNVVELCRELVSEGKIGGGLCYSCGPRGMVVALNEIASSAFEAHYTSLESVMACGVGACRGCTVPVREGSDIVLKTVCSDGPVFDSGSVDWEGWYW